MARPISIRLFAWLFALSCLLSIGLAFRAAGMIEFGFRLDPDAARTLATRILWVRLVGVAFALWLLLLIVIGRSRMARGALLLRWWLGLATSVAFLRGVGILSPDPLLGSGMVAISIAQLAIESFAMAILFGDDAAEWFDRRPVY